MTAVRAETFDRVVAAATTVPAPSTRPADTMPAVAAGDGPAASPAGDTLDLDRDGLVVIVRDGLVVIVERLQFFEMGMAGGGGRPGRELDRRYVVGRSGEIVYIPVVVERFSAGRVRLSAALVIGGRVVSRTSNALEMEIGYDPTTRPARAR